VVAPEIPFIVGEFAGVCQNCDSTNNDSPYADILTLCQRHTIDSLQNSRETSYSGGMLTYDTLAPKPGAFKAMTGLTVQEFDVLLAALRPQDEAACQEQRVATPRQRAPGGGVKPRYDLCERLLMTLVWVRLSLTCDAVGVLFAVDKSTVSRTTQPLLRLLRERGQETLGWPEEAQALLRTTDREGTPVPAPATAPEGDPALAHASEDSVAISDATEQRVERSADNATQKAHSSGKKSPFPHAL